MKKSELKQLISECISEILTEDKTAEIKKEYAALKKMKKSALDAEYQRHFRVSTPKGEPKDVLISDILGEKFNSKDIEKAFGLTEGNLTEGRMSAKKQAESIASDLTTDTWGYGYDEYKYVDDEMGIDISDAYLALKMAWSAGWDGFETAVAKELTKRFKSAGMK